MGRLIPQALYRRDSILDRPIQNGPTDITDYEGIWSRAARRIEEFDPDGRQAYSVLQRLKLAAGKL